MADHTEHAPIRYAFGPFRLDVNERRLTRGGKAVHIEPKSFDVLCYLLREAGRLVNKRELMDAVWPAVVVTESSLTRCIHQVRSALDDHADAPEYIETVPGAGYRFIAPVNTQEGAEHGARPARDRRVLVGGILLLAMLVLGVLFWTARDRPSEPAASINRLAVLPLTDLTGDSEKEYFVLGVHEALIAELSRLDDIDVISRTSVMRYRDTELPIPDIGRQLDVDAVVEGSVLRDGDQLTVVSQLIATEPERHLWSGRFDRGIGDLFQITAEIARGIANEISPGEDSIERPVIIHSRQVDPAAYDAYLRGRFKFQSKTADDYRMAQGMFRRAIEIDPGFAPAYSALAHTLGSAAIFGMVRPADSMPQAQTLAMRALQIDDGSEEAHMILAGVSFYWEWDSEDAERRIGRVLELNPSSAHAYRVLAEVHSATGRHEEALGAIEAARSLDPMSPNSQIKPALILYLQRDYQRAAEVAEAGLAHFPSFWPGHWLFCRSLAAQADHSRAIEACEEAVARSGGAPMALGTLAWAHARGGDGDSARSILAELSALRERRYVGSASFAIVHGALGEDDLAFSELQRAYEERDVSLRHAEHAAEFDALRVDPRFLALRDSALAKHWSLRVEN